MTRLPSVRRLTHFKQSRQEFIDAVATVIRQPLRRVTSGSRIMTGPSKKSLRPSLTPEHLLMFVEQLRLRADAFRRTLQDELRRIRALIDEQRVRQAKRRRHER